MNIPIKIYQGNIYLSIEYYENLFVESISLDLLLNSEINQDPNLIGWFGEESINIIIDYIKNSFRILGTRKNIIKAVRKIEDSLRYTFHDLNRTKTLLEEQLINSKPFLYKNIEQSVRDSLLEDSINNVINPNKTLYNITVGNNFFKQLNQGDDIFLSNSFSDVKFYFNILSKFFIARVFFTYKITGDTFYQDIIITDGNTLLEDLKQSILDNLPSNLSLYNPELIDITISERQELFNELTKQWKEKYTSGDLDYQKFSYKSLMSGNNLPTIKDYYLKPFNYIISGSDGDNQSALSLSYTSFASNPLFSNITDEQKNNLSAHIIAGLISDPPNYDTQTKNGDFQYGTSFWNTSTFRPELGTWSTYPFVVEPGNDQNTPYNYIKINENLAKIYQTSFVDNGNYKLVVGISSSITRNVRLFINTYENTIQVDDTSANITNNYNGVKEYILETTVLSNNSGIPVTDNIITYGMECLGTNLFPDPSTYNFNIRWCYFIKV